MRSEYFFQDDQKETGTELIMVNEESANSSQHCTNHDLSNRNRVIEPAMMIDHCKYILIA